MTDQRGIGQRARGGHRWLLAAVCVWWAPALAAACVVNADCPLGEICVAAQCEVDVEADRDRDGVPDGSADTPRDTCPDLPNPDQDDLDRDGRGDACDVDDDGDGVQDAQDVCPRTYNPAQSDRDGDGVGDACEPDGDHDGVPDDLDNCPRAANPAQQNRDADRWGDACDPDQDPPPARPLDPDGDGVETGGADGDNCPEVYNPDQLDGDSDGLGDLCDPCPDRRNLYPPRNPITRWPSSLARVLPDTDGDGVPDGCTDDDDGDGVRVPLDTCPWVANPHQLDRDEDGLGDACDPDIDGDEVPNALDPCPFHANSVDCGPVALSDGDGDGVPDAVDNCPAAVNPDQLDPDGDGLGAACDPGDVAAVRPGRPDADGDGVPDAVDRCPAVADPHQEDLDGDGLGDACDADDDGDGVEDAVDRCPRLANPDQADADGDGVGDACAPDTDGDGVPAALDTCPALANAAQVDTDGDGRGDACDGDDDGDGLPDLFDACPLVADPCPVADRDGDGRADDVDVCPFVADAGQADLDGDGRGDACDPDDDGDGVLDAQDGCPRVFDPAQVEADRVRVLGRCVGLWARTATVDGDGDGIPDAADGCPEVADPDQRDTDGDGAGDACDLDDDADGVPDAQDRCPLVVDPRQIDTDGDGLGDACDPDDDNDGTPDAQDACPRVAEAQQVDSDGDGAGDACDTCPHFASQDLFDADGDGLGNPCDPDADGDGVLDVVDACPWRADPAQDDRDCDGVADDCVPLALGLELCNGQDDDCDGQIDEGALVTVAPPPGPGGGENVSGQVGEPCVASPRLNCTVPGVLTCAAGASACLPREPRPAEVCDGVDQDCDGFADEGLPDAPCTAGVGACAADGVGPCVGGAWTCDAVEGAPTPEVCGDGIDNDCDGAVDQGCGCVPVFTARWPARRLSPDNVLGTRPDLAAAGERLLAARLHDDGAEQAVVSYAMDATWAGADGLTIRGRRPQNPDRWIDAPAVAWTGDRFLFLYALTDPAGSYLAGFTMGEAGNITGALPRLQPSEAPRSPALGVGDGRAALVWHDTQAQAPVLRWAVLDAAGAVTHGPYTLANPLPDVAVRPGIALANGLVGLSWRALADGGEALWFAAFDVTGAPVIPPTLVGPGAQPGGGLAASAATWLLGWPADGGAGGARVDADGVGVIEAALPAVGPVHLAATPEGFVAVAPIERDGAVQVGLIRLDATGAPLGQAVVVGADPALTARAPRVAWLGDEYAVIWQADAADGGRSVWVIRGQISCEEAP